MNSIIDIGFFPVDNPLEKLGDNFSEWENIGTNLVELNTTGSIVSAVYSIKEVDYTTITSIRELRRAYILLSMITSSFLKHTNLKILPKQIAMPLWHVSNILGISPICTHAGLDLWNFKKIDSSGPKIVENLEQITSFTGTPDEKYFFLIMTEIEDIGKDIFDKLLTVPLLVLSKDTASLIHILNELYLIIQKINITMNKMFTGCKPEVFYNVLRPYLAGWYDDGLIFEGVSNEPTRYKGGSAAQSSLIQLFDIVLGVYHDSPFFKEMREYMPNDHANILNKLELEMKECNIYEFIMKKKFITYSSFKDQYTKGLEDNFSDETIDDSDLKKAYKKCIVELSKFRHIHFEIAYKYVTKMNPESVKGTGGQELKTFLDTARKETTHNIK